MLSVKSGGKGDDDPTDTGIDGGKGILDLGKHPAADGAVFFIFNKVRARDGRKS